MKMMVIMIVLVVTGGSGGGRGGGGEWQTVTVLLSRNTLPDDSTQKPGPGAHTLRG